MNEKEQKQAAKQFAEFWKEWTEENKLEQNTDGQMWTDMDR